MNLKFNRLSAFTLIELLVVIVIIGILATISVATFNGYFAKARNADRIQTAQSVVRGLKAYQVLNNNEYPTIPSNTSVCLAQQLDQWCGGTASGNEALINTTFNSELISDGGFLPSNGALVSYAHEGTNVNIGDWKGMTFWHNNNFTIDGVSGDHYGVTFYLEGRSQNCGLNTMAWSASSTYVTDGDTIGNNTSSFPEDTQCFIPLSL